MAGAPPRQVTQLVFVLAPASREAPGSFCAMPTGLRAQARPLA